MPAAISPTAASRCCTRASRSCFFSSVTSWKVNRNPLAPRGVISGALLMPISIWRPSARVKPYSGAAAGRLRPDGRTAAGTARQLQHRQRRAAHGAGRGSAGDRLRRAVERQDPALHVAGRQAARQAVDDVLAERLQIGELRRRCLQLCARPAQPLGEVAAQRGDRHEPEHVEADGEDRDPRRRQRSSDTTGGSGDPPWYCATTRPAYISELSTLTISPPRHDCTVLAAMIGSA